MPLTQATHDAASAPADDAENRPSAAAADSTPVPHTGMFDSPLKPLQPQLPPGASSPQRIAPSGKAAASPTAILGHSSPAKSAVSTDQPIIPMHATAPVAAVSHSTVDRWIPPPAPAGLAIEPRELRRIGSPGAGSTLGCGAYGSVYRASWNGMLVAVKELDSLPSRLPEAASESARREEDNEALQDSYAEWMAEMAVWAELKHPGIVPLYGGYTHPKLTFVMQLLGGGALSDHLYASRPTHIPWSTLLHLMRQTASSLHYMHTRGLVHRDIKSFNVLLDEGGNAFLSDFGLSVALRPEDEEAFEKRQQPLIKTQQPSEAPILNDMRQVVHVTPRKGPRANNALLSPPKIGLAHPTPLPPHSPAHAARVMRSPHKPQAASIDPLDDVDDAAQPVSSQLPYPRFGVGLPGATGGPLGTYGFMAPELFTHARSYSRASDTYAFGCMLLEIITRAVPWGAMSPIDIARNVVEGRRPPIPRGTPQRFANLIESCWAQQARERPSMAHLLHELTAMEEEALTEEEEVEREEEAIATQQQQRHDRRMSASPDQQLMASPSPAAALVARMAAFGSPASSDGVQLSADELAALARSERLFYNQQLRKHHDEGRALRRGGTSDELNFPASPNFTDDSAVADDEAHKDHDEAFWNAVRLENSLQAASSPGHAVALRPAVKGASHQRHDSVMSAVSSMTDDANSNLVRCKARSRKSRKLLAQIARLMEEAELDDGSSSGDDGEAADHAHAVTTLVRNIGAPIVPAESAAAPAPIVSLPRNITPVLPYTLAASALLPLPISEPVTAAAAAAGEPQRTTPPIAAWAEPNPSSALAVSSPIGTVVAAENLLLQQCAATTAPPSASTLPVPPVTSHCLLTPSASSLVHFHAAPHSSSSAHSHSTPESASHSASGNPPSRDVSSSATPTPPNFLSPAKFARSLSTTWTPVGSEKSSTMTPAEASRASDSLEPAQARPPLTLPQRSLLPSLALPPRPALDSHSSPIAARNLHPTCDDEERKDRTPSSKAKNRAQVVPEEQLDAIVPRAEPEAVNHACCTIM